MFVPLLRTPMAYHNLSVGLKKIPHSCTQCNTNRSSPIGFLYKPIQIFQTAKTFIHTLFTQLLL